jgi:hypothetical protein
MVTENLRASNSAQAPRPGGPRRESSDSRSATHRSLSGLCGCESPEHSTTRTDELTTAERAEDAEELWHGAVRPLFSQARRRQPLNLAGTP